MSESHAGRRADELKRALTAVNGVPATPGNQIDVLRNGEQIFPAMLEAIEVAERSVELLTYVYWSGSIAREFAGTIAGAARRGVHVRVLLDAVGAKPVDDELVDQMRDAGADVRYFRPPDPRHPITATHRTHRKLLICDESVGFTGGVGIADEWNGGGRREGEWRDTHVRVTGPAVASLRAAFIDNWIEVEPCLFQPADRFPELEQHGASEVQVISGTSEPGWNTVSTSVRALIALAESRIRVTTAYFVPDDDLQERLLAAADRGVDVHLLLPGPNADKRFVQVASEARYAELLEAGVRVSCYRPSMLHAKTMTIDDSVAVIGSANLNQRSTSLDDEVDLIVFDPDVVAELDRDFDADLEYSDDLDLERWRSRNPFQRVAERVMAFAEPWM